MNTHQDNINKRQQYITPKTTATTIEPTMPLAISIRDIYSNQSPMAKPCWMESEWFLNEGEWLLSKTEWVPNDNVDR